MIEFDGSNTIDLNNITKNNKIRGLSGPKILTAFMDTNEPNVKRKMQ